MGFRRTMSRFAGLLARDRRERELADEIESHLQLHADENIRRGMDPAAARREAVIRLGAAEALKEEYREQRGLPALEHMAGDVRYAVRVLRKSPMFTGVAVLTIALGVAGPTVMFSMMKAWVLDPLPFARPGELVDVRQLDPRTSSTGSLSVADFVDFRRDARSFRALAGYRMSDARLTGSGGAERLQAAEVTPDFFDVLGVHAAHGRLFQAADAQAAPGRLVVLSHALWRDRFSSDPHVAGRSIRLDLEDHTVIGVLPDGFQFTLVGAVQVWRPLLFAPADATNRRSRSLVGVGRLQPDATVDQARGEVTRMAERLRTAYPDTNANRGVRLVPLAEEVRSHHDAGFLVPVLFAMVGCVLLIACVNVTSVMLARASTRRQEMAVRLAVGASRARVIRQWLVEHVLLFVVASAAGAVLAVYGTAWISSSIPPENRQFLRNNGVLTVDRASLLFALAVGALCGTIFGWLPAWFGSSTVLDDLRESTVRSTTGKAGTRLRGILVAAEMALALALLIDAALLVQTARNITRLDVGFEPRRLLTFQLAPAREQYRDDGALRTFYERLVVDLAGRPGVAGAAAGSLVPFGTEGRGVELFIDGEPDTPPATTPVPRFSQVTAGYADTMGLRLASGRYLNGSDVPGSGRVAMINETLAARHFAGRDPIGRRIRLDRTATDLWTIVGVVGDVKNFETTEAAAPQVYVPFAQWPARRMTVVVRSSGDSEALSATVRASVAAIDPAEPLSRLFPMESLINQVTGPYSTVAIFVLVLGAVTLLLSAVGVYGVISYNFTQRTREIGIRVALGARRVDVLDLVLRQVGITMLAGLGPGLLLAGLIGGAMKAFLVGVTATDWKVYTAMCVLLAIVALLAATAPARRAMAIDPATVLRTE